MPLSCIRPDDIALLPDGYAVPGDGRPGNPESLSRKSLPDTNASVLARYQNFIYGECLVS